MMSKYVVFSLALFLALASCSRKTVPPKNVNSQVVYPRTSNNSSGNVANPAAPAPSTGTTGPASVTNEKILVILDKGGRLAVSPSSLPPYVTANTKQLPSSMPLSATERNNLMARQKTLLPLALYVPDAYAGKSPRGQYYKYKGKFWYWKKADGFYYLDDIYYK